MKNTLNRTIATAGVVIILGGLVLAFGSSGLLGQKRGQAKKPPAEKPTAANVARWDLQQSGVQDDLIDVCFVNANEGWAVGRASTILHTRDGGKSWTRAIERRADGHEFTSVIFSSPTEGWVRAAGTMLHTGDGGETWSPATEIDRGVIFSYGAVVGATRFQLHLDHVYRTDSGGATWVRLGLLPRNDYQQMFFIDEQHGWVIAKHGEQSIGYTIDGGTTWNFVTEQVSNRNALIKFVSPTTGWAFGQDGSTLLASVDGGHTWKRQYTGIPGYQPLAGLVFLNEHEGFINTSDAVIHTINGGASWQVIGKFPPVTLSALSFPDNSHGWVVGIKGYISHYHVVGVPEGPR